MSETIEGHLERIVYFNEQNQYTVARLKVRGDPELVTVVGQMDAASFEAGEKEWLRYLSGLDRIS